VLVMVLLIVAVVSSLAVNFAGSFQLSLARGENRLHGAQARAYLVGAEELALKLLIDDRANNEVDSLDEDWALEPAPFPVEGGWLLAKVTDAQGFFNLNSLVGSIGNDEGQSLAQRFSPEQKRFIRLLQTFEAVPLSREEAVSVTVAIVDWLDADDQTSTYDGAESSYYSSLEWPYYAANQDFSSVSELRLVRHMTPELYAVLAPLVVVLPGGTDINVNTAPLEAFRTINVATVLEPLAVGDAQQLLESREGGAYESIQDFTDSPALVGLMPQGAQPEMQGLGISSEYFLLNASSAIARQRRQTTSLVHRTDTETQIIRRQDG